MVEPFVPASADQAKNDAMDLFQETMRNVSTKGQFPTTADDAKRVCIDAAKDATRLIANRQRASISPHGLSPLPWAYSAYSYLLAAGVCDANSGTGGCTGARLSQQVLAHRRTFLRGYDDGMVILRKAPPPKR